MNLCVCCSSPTPQPLIWGVSRMDSSVMLKVHIIPLPANKLAWHLFRALISCSGSSVLFNLGCEEKIVLRVLRPNNSAAAHEQMSDVRCKTATDVNDPLSKMAFKVAVKLWSNQLAGICSRGYRRVSAASSAATNSNLRLCDIFHQLPFQFEICALMTLCCELLWGGIYF